MGKRRQGASSRFGIKMVMALAALACSCGGRSDLDTPAPVASTAPPKPTSTCPYEQNDEPPGCVLQATDVNGADIGPTLLKINDSSPGSTSIEGYWIGGSTFALVGRDGNGRWFQFWGNAETLACGTKVPLSTATNDGDNGQILLRWGANSADFWISDSSELEIIAYEPISVTGPTPIRFEARDVSMVPGPTEPGSAPNHSTGTFTGNVSCRIENFWYIAPN